MGVTEGVKELVPVKVAVGDSVSVGLWVGVSVMVWVMVSEAV